MISRRSLWVLVGLLIVSVAGASVFIIRQHAERQRQEAAIEQKQLQDAVTAAVHSKQEGVQAKIDLDASIQQSKDLTDRIASEKKQTAEIQASQDRLGATP